AIIINSKKYNVPALDVRLGRAGNMLILDDLNAPLVLYLKVNDYVSEVVSIDRATGNFPQDVTPIADPVIPPTPTLPVYKTPDEAFAAWCKAVVDRNETNLITCYVAQLREVMDADESEASNVIVRYRDSVKDSKYKITSKSESGGAVEWKWEIRVSELLWTTKVKETIRFVKEDGSWRMSFESRY
ncbi:MAG: hypothetical protein RDV41_03935, partial [Planctomycetota bacterium]|nr:hypothetical protein [Planctomycetota bacterium]